jgi:hypothetical protein
MTRLEQFDPKRGGNIMTNEEFIGSRDAGEAATKW